MKRDKISHPDADVYAPMGMPRALFSNEAEQSVIGGLLLNNGAFDWIGDTLRAEHFFDEQHRRFFSTIAGMLLANKPVDVLTLHETLLANGHDDSIAYINELESSIPSSTNIRYYAGLVIERYRARKLVEVSSSAEELARDGSIPIDERIERVQAEIGRLAEQGAQREAASMDEMMVRALDRLEQRAKGNIKVYPTGLSDLDRMLGGGMRPGNVIVLGARPSMGKTALAITIAMHMSTERAVGFLSMEMSEEELTDRMLSLTSHVDLDHVQDPTKASSEFWDRTSEGASDWSRRRFFVDEQAGLTLHQVAAKVRNMKRRHAIDVVMIDYLQLMSGTDNRANRTYQLEEIMRGLKSLAKTLGVAVVVLAQVNRKVEGGMPTLADLKDSGSIEQDADVVAFIHRPIQHDPNLGEQWANYATLGIRKNRQGRTGDTHLAYIGNETRFGSWSGPVPSKSAAKSGRHDL